MRAAETEARYKGREDAICEMLYHISRHKIAIPGALDCYPSGVVENIGRLAPLLERSLEAVMDRRPPRCPCCHQLLDMPLDRGMGVA